MCPEQSSTGGVLNPNVHSAASAGENVIQIKDSCGEEDWGGERTMGRKERMRM